MNASTATRPERTHTLTARAAPSWRGRHRVGALADGRRRRLHTPALILLLAAALVLRLWGIRQGLPYSYNVDEAEHFVPKAIGFFSQGLNPHYFLNPPAYSYLLQLTYELWFGSADAVTRAYTLDPTQIYLVARVVAAVLGTVSVWLIHLAARRFFSDTLGLLAAAIFGLSFLPIFYSHLALNDVPTLAPVALSLYGISGMMRHGRLRDYAISGVAVGLAAATKYTGGIMLVCLVFAFAADAAGGRRWVAIRRMGAALLLALVAFVVANPYAALDFSAFTSGVSQQASLAAGQEPVKLGTQAGSGITYYIWTFTWGMGLVPSLAALGGAGLLLARRRIGMALVLLPAPIAFIVFMGAQQRFFGRWLMPIFPIAAILAAYGTVELVRFLARSRRIPVAVAGIVVAVLLLAQSVTVAIHNDAVLSRPDTRTLTRDWMVAHVPAGSKVVIEPVVPDDWASDTGVSLPWTSSGARWYRYSTWLSGVQPDGRPVAGGQRRFVVVDEYERVLYPALLHEYAQQGYCWVVIGSLQAGRAFSQPQDAPRAISYYAALSRQAKLMYHLSPFSPGSHPPPFSFDWSIDYYPRQYRLPGPEMSVYRLRTGDCA